MGETLELNELLGVVGAQLRNVENQVCGNILNALTKKPDAAGCDNIFGNYTSYLSPCVSRGFASRAAWFSRKHLIPAVLNLERELAFQFHKGALFYDTGLAHLLAGNEDGYEYFLAMTDEEEFRKTGGAHKRGTANLRGSGLAAQTVTERIKFGCDLLNGKFATHTANFAFVTGGTPIDAPQFDAWRQRPDVLDQLHQFELLRIIHDVEIFLGARYPNYLPSADNPFVLLRLAKAVSHLAQWVESCLTHWQGAGVGETLSGKLKNDPHFGKLLIGVAGSGKQFAGNPPQGADVDVELRKLLKDLEAAPIGNERHWRLLRILYIVRNSTAHTIEPNMAMYNDRGFLLNLLQVVFVSVFSLCQLKAKPMP
jgi:hypothetical protein